MSLSDWLNTRMVYKCTIIIAYMFYITIGFDDVHNILKFLSITPENK